MSIISVSVLNKELYINHGGSNNPSFSNSYPIKEGADGDKFIVFPDNLDMSIVLDELEDEFGPVNLGAYCFGGDWEDNALNYDEMINFFINEAEIPVLIEKS